MGVSSKIHVPAALFPETVLGTPIAIAVAKAKGFMESDPYYLDHTDSRVPLRLPFTM